MAFDHHANNRFFSTSDLPANVFRNIHLLFELLAGVGMAKVDHHLCREPCFDQTFFHIGNVLSAVVRFFAAAQNNMAIAVTAGIHDRRMTPFGHRQEAVWRPCCVDCINRNFDRAIGTVFKTNRARQT